MKNTGTVLIVDDEENYRANVARYLADRGFTVMESPEAASALQSVKENLVDVAFVDVLMPGMDGITLVGRLKEECPFIECVVVTGAGTIEGAVEAMRLGAFNFMTKPVRLKELEMIASRAAEKARLARQNSAFKANIRRSRGSTAGVVVSASEKMARLMREAEMIARTDSHVLIEGETGTGKEVVAEFIHKNSTRKEQPFLVLNCGALSDTLVDSELFGYEKGAFTGAQETRPGMVEAADGGTLLLDEIGDIPVAAQVRLLRFLERGLFRKVGSIREQSVDVRVIAATHRNLDQEAAEGRFREDLLHRLVVFRIKVPALRERPEDVTPLAEHFLSRIGGGRQPAMKLTEKAAEALKKYGWPGNVRELMHVVERAWYAASVEGSDRIEQGHVQLKEPTATAPKLISLAEAEKIHVLSILDHCDGNRQKAAELLGMTKRNLYRLLAKYKTGDEPAGEEKARLEEF